MLSRNRRRQRIISAKRVLPSPPAPSSPAPPPPVARQRARTTAIDTLNRLAGPQGLRQTGPALAPISANLEWPPEIVASFAISIRPVRFQGLQSRLGPWSSKIQLWNGTNGMDIKSAAWKQNKKVAPQATLRAGEIGCYDSHVRIWEHIVANQISMTLILEDDANIRYIPEHAKRLRDTFDELKKLGTPWDILYIGGKGTKGRNLSPSIAVPRNCNGLFAYCLTLQGARLLLARAKPYAVPVDVLVARLEDSHYVKAVAMDPPLCYVVPVHSDTVHIR